MTYVPPALPSPGSISYARYIYLLMMMIGSNFLTDASGWDIQVFLNIVLAEAVEEKAGGEKERIGMVVCDLLLLLLCCVVVIKVLDSCVWGFGGEEKNSRLMNVPMCVCVCVVGHKRQFGGYARGMCSRLCAYVCGG